MARWHSFMGGEEGPSYLFHVNSPLPEWEAKLPPEAPYWPDKVAERIERHWAEYELMRRKAYLVDNDRVPYLSKKTGTEGRREGSLFSSQFSGLTGSVR